MKNINITNITNITIQCNRVCGENTEKRLKS